jgi:hypothetical protein
MEDPAQYQTKATLRLHITPFDAIIKDIEEVIYPFLAEPISEEVEIVIARGNILQSYIASLVKYMADAKYYLDQKIKKVIPENKGAVSQPVMRMYCESLCEDENYLFGLIKGLLDKAYSENDWNRTLVSKAKMERAVNNQG